MLVYFGVGMDYGVVGMVFEDFDVVVVEYQYGVGYVVGDQYVVVVVKDQQWLLGYLWQVQYFWQYGGFDDFQQLGGDGVDMEGVQGFQGGVFSQGLGWY